ncbi:MAG: hypothetical protein HDQ88_04920 [Clostridia bacterium]|nr:hypothetical protein [Clostridia bacterium]
MKRKDPIYIPNSVNKTYALRRFNKRFTSLEPSEKECVREYKIQKQLAKKRK